MTTATIQAVTTFNHDLDGIGSVEVKATYFAGSITLKSVRRNSDYAFVTLSPETRRDLTNVARWYFQDDLR
jgi:hypothetical protein